MSQSTCDVCDKSESMRAQTCTWFMCASASDASNPYQLCADHERKRRQVSEPTVDTPFIATSVWTDDEQVSEPTVYTPFIATPVWIDNEVYWTYTMDGNHITCEMHWQRKQYMWWLRSENEETRAREDRLQALHCKLLEYYNFKTSGHAPEKTFL